MDGVTFRYAATISSALQRVIVPFIVQFVDSVSLVGFRF